MRRPWVPYAAVPAGAQLVLVEREEGREGGQQGCRGGLRSCMPAGLGLWRVRAGCVVVSVELTAVRRGRRQLSVWWHRRKGGKAAAPVDAGSEPKAD